MERQISHISSLIKIKDLPKFIWRQGFKSEYCILCYYTPNIRSMWGYSYVGVYSFRFSLCPSVRSFIRMFVRSSFRHRVKVFILKFIRPHILKTLERISFIFGLMVDIGLKFLSAPSRG